MRKVYVVGYGVGYARPIYNKQLVNNIEDADIVLFTGGEDVLPESYNKKNLASWGNRERDAMEIDAYRHMRNDQLAIGICRGAQLLCVLNGGNLVQDCDNHALGGGHTIISKSGEIYSIPSLHHQMMYPYDLAKDEFTNLFISAPTRSSYYVGDNIDSRKILEFGEPEVTFFHKHESPIALAVQGHPEMVDEDSLIVNKYNDWIDMAFALRTK